MLHCYIIRLQINSRNYDLHSILSYGRYLNWEIKKPIIHKGRKSLL